MRLHAHTPISFQAKNSDVIVVKRTPHHEIITARRMMIGPEAAPEGEVNEIKPTDIPLLF